MEAITHHIPRIKPMNIQILYISIFLTFTQIIETYLFSDFEFLIWLFILICLDTLTGMIYSWREKTFSSFGFSKVIIKVILYAIALIVVNVLQNFKIGGVEIAVFDWIDYFLLTAMVLREAISIFENIARIEPALLPKWIVAHLKAFDTNLNQKATVHVNAADNDTGK